MRKNGWLSAFITLIIPLTAFGMANEAIPYTIKSVVTSGVGFVELVGPGKLVVKNKIHPYRKGKHVRVTNIHSLSEVEGNSERCVMHYASYDFSENITVQQPCSQILQVIKVSEGGQQSSEMPKFKIE